MRFALTGTPGTGKSEVAELLAIEYGYRVIDVNSAAHEYGCIIEHDEERDTDIVDVDLLRKELARVPDDVEIVVLEGHLSHLLDVEFAVVLRCHPGVLVNRLEEKGFSPTKTRENLEAETVDVVLIEAVDILSERAVFELDTTSLTPRETASVVNKITRNEDDMRRLHKPGGVDWLAEGGDWL